MENDYTTSIEKLSKYHLLWKEETAGPAFPPRASLYVLVPAWAITILALFFRHTPTVSAVLITTAIGVPFAIIVCIINIFREKKYGKLAYAGAAVYDEGVEYGTQFIPWSDIDCFDQWALGVPQLSTNSSGRVEISKYITRGLRLKSGKSIDFTYLLKSEAEFEAAVKQTGHTSMLKYR